MRCREVNVASERPLIGNYAVGPGDRLWEERTFRPPSVPETFMAGGNLPAAAPPYRSEFERAIALERGG